MNYIVENAVIHFKTKYFSLQSLKDADRGASINFCVDGIKSIILFLIACMYKRFHSNNGAVSSVKSSVFYYELVSYYFYKCEAPT